MAIVVEIPPMSAWCFSQHVLLPNVGYAKSSQVAIWTFLYRHRQVVNICGRTLVQACLSTPPNDQARVNSRDVSMKHNAK